MTNFEKIDLKAVLKPITHSGFPKFSELMDNPNTITMIDFCAQEKADYKAVLTLANSLSTKRIAANLLRQFSNSYHNQPFHLDDSNEQIAIGEFERNIADFNKHVDAEFWKRLRWKFGFEAVFSRQAHSIAEAIIKDENNEYVEFNQETVKQYCDALAELITKDALARYFRKFRHLMTFNFLKNGNVEIHLSHENSQSKGSPLENREAYRIGLYQMREIAIALLTVDTEAETSHPSTRKDLDLWALNVEGIEYFKNNNGVKLKLSKEIGQKFQSITAITPHTI